MPSNVAVLIGSLRKESLNRKMANALIAMAPASLSLKEAPIRELPLYDSDLEGANPPAAWNAFRQQVRGADAVLFVTPEYNRSVPGPAEERDRCRFASLRQQRLEWQARRGRQRVARCDRRLWRQPSSAPVVRVPRYAAAATARGLHRQRGQAVRGRRQHRGPQTRDFAAKYLDAFVKWIERVARK